MAQLEDCGLPGSGLPINGLPEDGVLLGGDTFYFPSFLLKYRTSTQSFIHIAIFSYSSFKKNAPQLHYHHT